MRVRDLRCGVCAASARQQRNLSRQPIRRGVNDSSVLRERDAVFAVCAILATRVRYVPMCDGYEYASAINRAATNGFHLGDLRLAGHASHAYSALAIAAQALAPGQAWPILALNTLLWLISVA